MATITEDYVSFEIAKLLVKKSFDYTAEYESYYTLGGTIVYFKDNPQDINIAPRITLQMAMKWLREMHNITIVIEPHMYDYINEKNSSYVTSLWQGDNYYENITSKDYPTYEEAVEMTIKYALENLV